MAVEVIRVNYRITAVAGQPRKEQYVSVTAQYGGEEVDIPLPVYWVVGTDSTTLDSEVSQGMEDLAEALLRYRDHMRTISSGDHQL